MSNSSRGPRIAVIEYAKAAPTAGAWTAGDLVLTDETSGGTIGWRCTSSGSPGLWAAIVVAPDGVLTLTGAASATSLTLADTLTVPTTDLSGTAGDGEINKISGKNAIALGATACVVTCSKCAATSRVLITPLDVDATLVTYKAVADAGSFTVTGGAAANAIWKFQWLVIN